MFKIENLYASAWVAAIMNVGEILGMEREYAIKEEWEYIEQVAEKLGARFDENGEIMA